MNNAANKLARFVAECQAALRADGGSTGREHVRQLLQALLQDEEFVEQYCRAPKAGLYRLYRDPALDFEVLAHVNDKPRVSPPHDHGDSWAIYGQAVEYTDVTEWARVSEQDGDRVELRPMKTYRIAPGQAAIYQDGMIHSIDYPGRSSFVRVTGTNLDEIRRLMFDLEAGTVKQMTPQRAT